MTFRKNSEIPQILLLPLIFLLLSFSTPAHAEDTISPKVYVLAGAGFHLYYPDTISGSDRYIWHARGGAGLRVGHFFAFEGAFRYGGIIYKDLGYASAIGGNVGFMLHYIPETYALGNNLYTRLGLSFESIDRMRQQAMLTGLYFAPGFALPLDKNKRLFLENELFIQKTFSDIDGAMGHWRLGLKGGLRFEF